MRTNPFYDSLLFLIGQTPDHDALEWAKYLLVVLYAALLIGSAAIAWRVWSRLPDQQSPRTAAIWLMRLLIGTMWFQGSLWKLPLPVSGGFRYWTEQLAEFSWLPLHATLVRDVLLPNIHLLDPVVWVTETLLAVSLLLGIGVRLAGLVGILLVINLWVGLYHREDEWPWNYIFLVFVHGFFILDRAGEHWGLDALRRRVSPGL